jgi:hypothetical protein
VTEKRYAGGISGDSAVPLDHAGGSLRNRVAQVTAAVMPVNPDAQLIARLDIRSGRTPHGMARKLGAEWLSLHCRE